MTRYAKGSDTSKLAATRIAEQVNDLQRLVLNALRMAGSEGLTDEEIGLRCRLNGNTVRPRRNELRDLGLVFKTKLRRKLRSTGNSATVWVHFMYRDVALIDEPDPREQAPELPENVAAYVKKLRSIANALEIEAETIELTYEPFKVLNLGNLSRVYTLLDEARREMIP